MTREPRATIDFETRSAANLKACGTWRYSVDPTTEPLCMAFRLPYWERGRTGLWHPAFPHLGIEEPANLDDLGELVRWLEQGELVEAHNIFFEFCIWNNILRPRFDFPAIRANQWLCSAAKAASYALPRGLDEAIAALRVKIRKDTRKTETEGVKVLKAVHVSKKTRSPRKSRKAERAAWAAAGVPEPALLWHESVELFDALWAYCRQDVLAEEALSESLEDLHPHEVELFHLDLKMNTRGFQLDTEAVSTALRLVEHETEVLNDELAVVTDGYVLKTTQRDDMKVWLATEDCLLPDTQAATLDGVLTNPRLTPKARRAIELMRALGRSSTAKYSAMDAWMDPADGRVRGGLLYHGASTGRWSGKGIQPHNFPKLAPTAKGAKPTADDINTLWVALKTWAREAVAQSYGGMMEALSAGLRGAIIARPGHTLYVADFASIEARVLLWLAEEEAALDLFRSHGDIYCDMAEAIYGYAVNKKDHPKERGLGKIAILGLGYQMGAAKFTASCAAAGVEIPEDIFCDDCGEGISKHGRADHAFESDEDLETMTGAKVVAAYRSKYWRVRNLWNDQEAAAIAAVVTRSPVVQGKVTWVYTAPFLYCVLPSGRRLAYSEPRVKTVMMPWGKEKQQLSFMGIDGYSKKWKRQTIYGGLIVENIVQAISRDLMADGMLRAEERGVYEVVLSVHDELIAEARIGTGSVHEFEQLMSETPDWADGCPVEAEGWTGERYHK